MAEIYYASTLAVSVVLMLVYSFFYHRHYDVHITLVFVLVPLSNLALLYLNNADSLEAALLANKFVYVASCYLMLTLTLVVFNLCDIRLGHKATLLLYLITTVVFCFTQLLDQGGLYYKSVTFTKEDGGVILEKQYGPLHTVFYAMVIIYFLMGIGAIVYSYFVKNQVSRKFIILLAFPEALSIAGFFIGRRLSRAFSFIPNVEFVSLTYDVALIVYLVIVHRLVLYDISDTVIDSMVQTGDTGFISFDFGFNYLGSNDTAKEIFPELSTLTVDKKLDEREICRRIESWLAAFKADNTVNETLYRKDDKTYLITVNYLSDGHHKRGYQLFITDDTKNQQYIALLDSFNTELKAEVAQKTQHIVEMHDNLLMSMATMVESRDNSTGGHIRRTSEGVRILIEEMKNSGKYDLSEQFCRNLIKAAPMHDLGKIAVEDRILKKPGRFTDKEFEIMKSHAAEGARIVHEILKGTDDEEFKVFAENVAHYHHERWDGSGYPEGLKGEEIPLEARIMAIADVYDALVSERVYKPRMSFEQADAIIMEGMGKHFDKALEPCYVAARPKLEEYYRNNDK